MQQRRTRIHTQNWPRVRTYLKLVASRPMVPEYPADDAYARERNKAYYR